MTDYLDPDRWYNGGEHSSPTHEAAAFAAMERELTTMKLKLSDAIKLAEAAAHGSPYKQTPHFWERITELKRWTTELKK
jgi:hypothetical protein